MASSSQRRKERKRDKARWAIGGREGRVDKEKYLSNNQPVTTYSLGPHFAELGAGRGQETYRTSTSPLREKNLIREAKPICIGQDGIERNSKILASRWQPESLNPTSAQGLLDKWVMWARCRPVKTGVYSCKREGTCQGSRCCSAPAITAIGIVGPLLPHDFFKKNFYMRSWISGF